MASTSTATPSLTAGLAEYVLGLRPADAPAPIRERAALLLIDELGAGLNGSTAPGATIVHDEARARYREGHAAVWGRDTRLTPTAAALVNATQAHAFELDDYHPGAKLHPGTVVVPAALAVLDREHSFEELLSAMVVAYDVMIRLGLAMDSSSTRRRGWHLTGLTGPFGAAAAAGRLRGLDREALVAAFGVAGSCSAGLFAFSREGSMTKQLHAGRAAEAGLTAVELALRGLSAPAAVLEAEDGGCLPRSATVRPASACSLGSAAASSSATSPSSRTRAVAASTARLTAPWRSASGTASRSSRSSG